MSRRQFAVADCVLALGLVAIAFFGVGVGVGAALLIAGVLGFGHVAAWYSLRNRR